jgi:hypothetical protein
MERVATIIVDEIGLGKEEDFANGSALLLPFVRPRKRNSVP